MNWRPIVLVVLVIALAGVGFYYIKKGASVPSGYRFEERVLGTTEPVSPPAGETERLPARVPTSKPAPLARRGIPEVKLEEEEVFIYDSTDLRNPMAPLLAKAEPEAGKGGQAGITTGLALIHVVDGIIWSPTNPLAIIDGNVVGVGNTLQDGSVVTQVGRDCVMVEYGGKQFRLTLE